MSDSFYYEREKKIIHLNLETPNFLKYIELAFLKDGSQSFLKEKN